MTTTTPESRGRIAYTAYGRKVGFKTYDGRNLPAFDELEDPQRDAWVFSANVIWDLATTGKATI